jgi:hypothetical protein
MFLPDIMTKMGKHLDYYWMFALIYPKVQCPVLSRNVSQGWKPLLLYQNGFKRTEEFFPDIIHGSGREKTYHEWEQSSDELTSIIEYFTRPGDIILDPFMGSGSTLIIANKLKRKVIGCDINEGTFNLVKERISLATQPELIVDIPAH